MKTSQLPSFLIIGRVLPVMPPVPTTSSPCFGVTASDLSYPASSNGVLVHPFSDEVIFFY